MLFITFSSLFRCSPDTDMNFPAFTNSNPINGPSNLSQMGYLKASPYNFGIMSVDPIHHAMSYHPGKLIFLNYFIKFITKNNSFP